MRIFLQVNAFFIPQLVALFPMIGAPFQSQGLSWQQTVSRIACLVLFERKNSQVWKKFLFEVWHGKSDIVQVQELTFEEFSKWKSEVRKRESTFYPELDKDAQYCWLRDKEIGETTKRKLGQQKLPDNGANWARDDYLTPSDFLNDCWGRKSRRLSSTSKWTIFSKILCSGYIKTKKTTW